MRLGRDKRVTDLAHDNPCPRAGFTARVIDRMANQQKIPPGGKKTFPAMRR